MIFILKLKFFSQQAHLPLQLTHQEASQTLQTNMRFRCARLKLWRLSSCLLVTVWLIFSTIYLSMQREGSGFEPEIYRSKRASTNCEDASEAPRPYRYTSWLPEKDTNKQQCRWQQMRNQLSKWQLQVQSYCSANVVTLSTAGFLKLRGVIIDPSRAIGRLGGEEIRQVLNQPEREEYWTLKSGAFQTVCSDVTSGTYLTDILEPINRTGLNSTFNQYLTATVTLDPYQFERMSVNSQLLNVSVLAVTRHEYANLYQTIIHLYNAFANSIFFGIDPAEATVLLIDGHPRGSLDPIWNVLFRRVIRMGQLTRPHILKDMIWVAEGHESPMQANRVSLPLIEEFRQFILSRYEIPLSQHVEPQSKSCSGSQVVLILRRDYLAHPRNPNGRVTRKIANEAQVFAEISAAFPQLRLNVAGVAMEKLTFKEQLNLIVRTRVLIGMHGAGLTHATFLPKGSGLIELFPTWLTQKNFHFRNIAAWRGVAYEQWVNGDNKTDLPIVVPNGVVTRLMHNLLQKMACL